MPFLEVKLGFPLYISKLLGTRPLLPPNFHIKLFKTLLNITPISTFRIIEQYKVLE